MKPELRGCIWALGFGALSVIAVSCIRKDKDKGGTREIIAENMIYTIREKNGEWTATVAVADGHFSFEIVGYGPSGCNIQSTRGKGIPTRIYVLDNGMTEIIKLGGKNQRTDTIPAPNNGSSAPHR